MKQALVVIPFRGLPTTMTWVMEGLACQNMPKDWSLRVRVMGDGCTPPPPPLGSTATFEIDIAPWAGVAEAKNRPLKGAHADAVIFMNADTRPEPNCVAAHLQRLESLGKGFMVLGSAPYEKSATPTVFDALKEETPMIFFFNRMEAGQLYDFRHAWTLNLAVWHDDLLRSDALDQHVFEARLRPYGHEDIEWGYRLMGAKKCVYYDPAARVVHRHPMTFEQYLNREEALGLMGPVLHDVSPQVFATLFGTTDIHTLAADFAAWVKMDAAEHRWIWRRMMEWADLPANALGDGAPRQRTMMALYQMHIPLKRLAFRLGFLRGMKLRDDALWQERKACGLWKKIVQS